MTEQNKAYLYTGVAVLLWSTVASAFKLALSELDTVQVLFIACLVSVITLATVLGIQGKLPELRQSKSDLRRSALLGLLNPFLYYLVLFKAYSLLPAQEAQPLNWTWPITLTLLSALLLKQRLNFVTIIAIVLSFCGVLVISTRGAVTSWHFTNWLGDVLAVGSSVLWALYWIFNIKDSREPVVKLFWNFVFGTVYISIFMFAFADLPDFTKTTVLAAVWIGVFEMGVTFVFWLKALSLSRDSSSVGIIAYLTPFISLIFIHFIVGEQILVSSVLGLILIVAGILVQTFTRPEY